MRNKAVFLVAAALCFAAPATATDVKAVQKAVADDWNVYLGPLFDYFHRNPELSFMETNTAARMAKELRTVPGMVVTEKVGGTGVVGVLKNGAGPTVLVRADMDGLPVQERSGLANASTVRQKDRNGVEQPVMHACGHDTHITALLGTARRLAALKNDWSGTVIFVVQPAEEIFAGAKAMMNDNLYKRFGKPDYALGFHVGAGFPTGKIAMMEGITYSAADTLDIIVHGVSAHGASPHMGKDPVVMGAEMVIGMQTMLGRSIPPLSPAVITVGAFHAGTKHNIISDRAELSVTTRADDLETRDAVIAGIRRVVAGVGEQWGMTGDKAPEVKVREDERAIPNVNDPALTKRLRTAISAAFGADILLDPPRQGMGSEDFPFLVGEGVKSVYYVVGGTPMAEVLAGMNGGPAVAGHHSPLFKVDGEQAVKTGAQTMTVSVLELLGKKG